MCGWKECRWEGRRVTYLASSRLMVKVAEVKQSGYGLRRRMTRRILREA